MELYSVVQPWISLTVEDGSVVHDEFRKAVGRIMGVFYANDGLIGLRDPEWLQGDFNVLIGLFHRVGLVVNVAKSKTMNFQTGAIFTGIPEEDFSWRRTGDGDTYQEHL